MKDESRLLLRRREIKEGFSEGVACDLELDELLEFKGRAFEEFLI